MWNYGSKSGFLFILFLTLLCFRASQRVKEAYSNNALSENDLDDADNILYRFPDDHHRNLQQGRRRRRRRRMRMRRMGRMGRRHRRRPRRRFRRRRRFNMRLRRRGILPTAPGNSPVSAPPGGTSPVAGPGTFPDTAPSGEPGLCNAGPRTYTTCSEIPEEDCQLFSPSC